MDQIVVSCVCKLLSKNMLMMMMTMMMRMIIIRNARTVKFHKYEADVAAVGKSPDSDGRFLLEPFTCGLLNGRRSTARLLMKVLYQQFSNTSFSAQPLTARLD